MAESYGKRNDVSFLQQSNPRAIYAVKMIEDADLDTLEIATNVYLLSLPNAAQQWIPHLVDTQLLHYGTGGNAKFVMKITVYASGTINAPPL
jgi:hypothetical protein